MTPETAEVLTRVSEEIEVQLVLLETEGLLYAQRYAEGALVGNQMPPRTPAGMHPLIGRALRDLTLDELVARRRA